MIAKAIERAIAKTAAAEISEVIEGDKTTTKNTKKQTTEQQGNDPKQVDQAKTKKKAKIPTHATNTNLSLIQVQLKQSIL